jgi:hypothetical protein
MTNPLVPEPRVNKNGVTSIKHVRAVPAAKKTRKAAMPAPSAAPETVVKAATPATAYPFQSRSVFHNHMSYAFRPDAALDKHLRQKYPSPFQYNSFEFDATDTEVYSVLSVTKPEQAVLLLKTGVRTAETAIAELRDAGAEDLIKDNSAMSARALQEGIQATDFLSYYASNPSLYESNPERFFESTLGYSDRALGMRLRSEDAKDRLGQKTHSLQSLIDSKQIRLRDVRTIGSTRLFDAMDDDGALVEAFKSLKNGTCRYKIEDLDRWIDRFELSGKLSMGNRVKIAVYDLGGRHGAEYMKTLPSNGIALSLCYEYGKMANGWGYTLEREREFIAYANTIDDQIGTDLNDDEYRALFESGISTEAARRGLAKDYAVDQIIAIENHGIAPGLSDGWI